MPENWAVYKKEELRYLMEEELRILYVAATRTEQALFISSSAKNNNKNPWQLLFELPDIEEFKIPHGEDEEISREITQLSLADFHSQTNERTIWLQGRKEKSYDYWSPTKDKDYTEVVTIEREKGGGKDWGTVIHQVFEKVVKDVDVTSYIPLLLGKFDIPIEKETEVRKAIDVLKQSDFYKELQAAENVLTEVPFMLKVEKENPLYEMINPAATGRQPYFVKGVIDLVYKIEGAWKIIDYKTDYPSNEEDFKNLYQFYQEQILFYKKAWETITGETVISEKLFFIMERNK